jgi:hypothetical protein
MHMTTETLKNPISLKRLIWLMDDVSSKQLLNITQAHLRLVKESLNMNTNPTRRNEIKADIDRLRLERDTILNEYKIELKGDNNNE